MLVSLRPTYGNRIERRARDLPGLLQSINAGIGSESKIPSREMVRFTKVIRHEFQDGAVTYQWAGNKSPLPKQIMQELLAITSDPQNSSQGLTGVSPVTPPEAGRRR